MSTITDIYQNSEKWLRLITLIDYTASKLCKEVLHKNEGLPYDGAQLYCKLKIYKGQMQYKDQKEILCPPNGLTDESKFDITLDAKLIEVMFKPKYNLLINDLRKNMNHLYHTANKDISQSEFEKEWNRMCATLQGHGFTGRVQGLKTGNLLTIEKLGKTLDFIKSEIQGSEELLLLL